MNWFFSARLHEASFSCHFCTFLWSPDSLDVWLHSSIQSQKKFAGDLEDSKTNIRSGLVHFQKSLVFSNKLDVQETDFNFTQFYRSGIIFLIAAGLRMDGIPALDLWELVFEVLHFWTTREPGETRWQSSSQTCITPHQSSTTTSFQQILSTFHPVQRILIPVPCCVSLRTLRR